MRDLPEGMADYYAGSHVKPLLLAQLYFASGTAYVWNGIGEITWEGNTYVGGGQFVGVTPVEETQQLEAKGIVVSLNGISANLIALALADGQTRGRPFRLYLGYTDADYIITEATGILAENGDAIISELNEILVFENGAAETGDIIAGENGDLFITETVNVSTPYRLFAGIMDVPEYSTDGKTADIRLSIENILIIGQRSKISRYTNEDQRKLYPTDRGLEFINQLQDKEVIW